MARGFSSSSPYAFGSTSPRLKKQPPVEADRLLTKAYMKNHIATAPKVSEMRVQREGAMAEDIGVLQDTIIRASWGKLPRIWQSKFWSYMWKLLKSKATGMYS
jgi:protein MBA1